MEYREQLEYIKEHGQKGEAERRRRKNKKGKKKKKLSVVDKFLWRFLFLAEILFILIMWYVKYFPIPYMIGVGGVFLSILMIIRIMQEKAIRHPRRRPRGKLLALLSIVAIVFGGYYLLKIDVAMDKIATGEENGAYVEEHGIDVTQQPFNIYISGIDVYGEITKESRSDVNLIVTVNPNTHKILITTTPRDYYVTIPEVSGEYRDKLTHAGIYGIDTSIATLGNLYSTEIPFYARVNFTSVIDIIDAMGGIEIESEVAFTTSKAAGKVVEIKEGINHLNGKEALAFVRERKAFADGDHQRGKNQQILLSALIKKAISPMILLQANEMINSVVGNAETNMSEQQIKALLKLQLDDLKGWDIESVAATGDDSGKQYCFSYSGGPLYVCIPDATCVEEISQKMEAYLSY